MNCTIESQRSGRPEKVLNSGNHVFHITTTTLLLLHCSCLLQLLWTTCQGGASSSFRQPLHFSSRRHPFPLLWHLLPPPSSWHCPPSPLLLLLLCKYWCRYIGTTSNQVIWSLNSLLYLYGYIGTTSIHVTISNQVIWNLCNQCWYGSQGPPTRVLWKRKEIFTKNLNFFNLPPWSPSTSLTFALLTHFSVKI